MTRAATNGRSPHDSDDLRIKSPPNRLSAVNTALQTSNIDFSTSYPYRPSTARSSPSRRNADESDETESDEDELVMRGSNGRGPNKVKPVLSRAASEYVLAGRQQQQQSGVESSGGARSDGRTGSDGRKRRKGVDEANMRHGWEAQLLNEEVTRNLSENFFMYYEDKRHDSAGNLPEPSDPNEVLQEWRMKDRLKTVSALLAVCLNVGVDPPDVIKTNPCARLECWIDPVPPDSNQNSNNTNAQIGKNLQSQYENLSLRTRYKVILDPTIEELKKYTTQLRRTAHAERLLFHYNGHGVPRPTSSGEVWCFNRSYTQYIPISLFDIQEWVGAPGLWVWDCGGAAGIIQGFLEAAQKHSSNQADALARDPNRAQQQPLTKWEDSIHLAACKHDQVLPTNPDLPADLFTACLTTPITMAVRFFILQNPLTSTSGVSLAQARNIPGKVSERRTPLGELNWIFTAITDTIAWNMLPKALFKKLFRQDLMVAALFRNFLLAQRVMRMYHCNPVSYPSITDTYDHPLWKSWDLAVEMILSQLPKLIEQTKANELAAENVQNGQAQPIAELEYQHSDFFADQLSAFEVYLSSAPSNPGALGYAKPPEQLPIVLQVLLSQVHRLRALCSLSKFLDLGPWAVSLALNIGIFPYVLKLLQSQALELKGPMVFIWTRILAVDSSCQNDLLKDHGYSYFTGVLLSGTGIPLGSMAEHRAMCAFVIAVFCKDMKPAKLAILESSPEVIENCLSHLHDMDNPLLRQFSLLCLSHLVRDCGQLKDVFIAQHAPTRIVDRSHDPVPEVRVACIHALTSFISAPDTEAFVQTSAQENLRTQEEHLLAVIQTMGVDGSSLVRKELTILYSEFVLKYMPRFLCAAWEQLLEEQDKKRGHEQNADDFVAMQSSGTNDLQTINGTRSTHQRSVSASVSSAAMPKTRPEISRGTVYRAVWRQLMILSADPHPEIARNAGIIVDNVLNALLDSPLGSQAEVVLESLSTHMRVDIASVVSTPAAEYLTRQHSRDAMPETPPSPAPSVTSKPDGYFALSRTASVAAAMKNMLWGGGKTPAEPSSPGSPTHTRRSSIYSNSTSYRSRPLTPYDAALLPPDALDSITNRPHHQEKAQVPPTPFFRERDRKTLPPLPLKSDFFEWAASHFREPQLRPSEADEPGSKDYNERLWRRNRNDKIIASTQPLKEAAGSQPWDKPCGYFGIGAAPVKMLFHQFENHLVTSDDRDSIAVWDWEKANQTCRFSNNNPYGSRVTEIRFINEDDIAMLMVGSSDGVIKIYRNYNDQDRVQQVASFRALSDLVPSDKGGSGLVFDWQQGQGKALVAGDDRVVRVWHVGTEMSTRDIGTRSSACITSLTSDQVEGNVFVAGFGTGSVKAYDQRCEDNSCMIKAWNSHNSWVVGVHLQRGGLRELISAESNGCIRLWDLRYDGPVASLDPPGKRETRSLRTLSVHEHAPVFATGGKDHTIRMYNTQLQPLSTFEPYMSYLRTGLTGANRNAPITATAFHPHRMMLACGAVNDGHVNLFKCDVEAEERPIVEEWGV